MLFLRYGRVCHIYSGACADSISLQATPLWNMAIGSANTVLSSLFCVYNYLHKDAVQRLLQVP